ncbi:hypothetical protein BDN70DRAFT_79803 [Pholiota conissans]|uniref:Uncharacterized protein n=1 Tax=Pholiota conissans TaxID=109636 RepID=A0A9P5YYL1_9AGAR|nr:hypothetical protein BDN70DRAFT_79803 [Pholiota conissans]
MMLHYRILNDQRKGNEYLEAMTPFLTSRPTSMRFIFGIAYKCGQNLFVLRLYSSDVSFFSPTYMSSQSLLQNSNHIFMILNIYSAHIKIDGFLFCVLGYFSVNKTSEICFPYLNKLKKTSAENPIANHNVLFRYSALMFSWNIVSRKNPILRSIVWIG